MIPVLRPQLPTTDELVPYLRRIDASRYYSNHGPLVREFEHRLAAHFGVAPDELTTASNGTSALTAALMATGSARTGKRCLVPSFTYVASAAAARAANLVPHFVDVDERTWMLDVEALVHRIDLSDVAAVIVVSAFGAPVNAREWDDFTEMTGIPVVIDAAGSFDTMSSVESARPGTTPVVVSFHATKVFGIGEGAVIVSRDASIATRARQILNFGILGVPESKLLGFNGKLSEYHAAVGLAMLDQWPRRRTRVSRVTNSYRKLLERMDGIDLTPGYAAGWVSSYCNVIARSGAVETGERMKDIGIETRRWWGSGVSAQPAYAHFPCDPLPVTESLAKHVIGIPFYHDLSDHEIESVVSALRSSVTEASEAT
jgi:dTDP-4-amino-4,6-dideoxygalactose transaminase